MAKAQSKVKPPAKAKSAAHAVSPLAPKSFAKLPPLAGVRLAAGAAGVRYAGRTDVLMVTLAAGTQAAGVFTRSKTASAPVDWCRTQLKSGTARALVVNSGNANAFTGKAGMEGAEAVARAAADALGCAAREVMLASTGVIGEPLPTGKITRVLSGLVAQGAAGNWRAAADAIMTTDTYPKAATATALIDGVKVTINGIAKGSGMIAPDMATMLSFVFTDASLPASVLQALLKDGVADTFNAVTIDGDTSTSDTLMIFATGKAGNARIARAADPR
ncbi:MAG TPA: bifunctional ornithine acetyltransferase/N-acetylglutamate synthase, partial [Rhizomicrobium sp.]|nr:bifunctional ornithine acetyltransferase/N-acetylglutamate synthase [Rhizomicrobium sp.]